MSNVIQLCNCNELHPAHKELTPFTKNDWYGYAGATKFVDGREPLIAYVTDVERDTHYTITCGGSDQRDRAEAVVHIDTTDQDGTLRYSVRYFQNVQHAERYANFLASNPDMIESLHILERA